MVKEIALTRGKVALVDDADFEWLSQHKWYAHQGTKRVFYAVRTIWRGAGVASDHPRMHREIMKPPTGFDIDHIDGNGLNNQRSNLRLSNRSQNNANTPLRKSRSPFKGVALNRQPRIISERWIAKITAYGKQMYLGSYDTPEEAAMAYDAAAVEHFGEFAMTNAKLGLLKDDCSEAPSS